MDGLKGEEIVISHVLLQIRFLNIAKFSVTNTFKFRSVNLQSYRIIEIQWTKTTGT